jgi:predicted RNase H-like HicB family nuclease
MHHVKTYTITLIPAAHGRTVHAVCHALPDCAVTGKDKREALELIEDRIRARIMQATLEHRPIPEDRTSTKFIWMDVGEFLV